MKNTGRKPSWTTEQLDAALRAYAAGETSVRDVKQRFGVAPSTLLRYCKERGIPVRPSGLTGVKGADHPTWRGGFRLDDDGYMRTYAPDHPWPRSSGYVFEHVRVMELHIGRRLLPNETVHHIDEDKSNNLLSNLQIKERGPHSRLHRLKDTANRTRDEHGRFA